LPNSRSGVAVKGGPSGPSEASREAAPLTAGLRRLPAASDPSRGRSAAALGQVRFEIAPAEAESPPNLEVRKAAGAGEVIDRGHRQPKQVGDLVGREQLMVERDDRVAHDGLRIVQVEANGSAASSRIASAPTARAARRTASATGSAAW